MIKTTTYCNHKLGAKYCVLLPYEIQQLNFTACLDIEAVKNDLFKAENQGDVEAILEKHSENFDEDSFSLEDRLPLIDECFKVCISLKLKLTFSVITFVLQFWS